MSVTKLPNPSIKRDTAPTHIASMSNVRGPMRLLLIIFSLTHLTPTYAGSNLPPEIQEFIVNRDLCDHFRGEPFEGNNPEQIERREFVFQSIEIYCPGTDRRLAALKKRYKNNSEAMKRLSNYEEKSEE